MNIQNGEAVDSSGLLPGFVAFPNDWDAESPAPVSINT